MYVFAPCCLYSGCKRCAVLIFDALRGSIFPHGSWSFSPPMECTESRELALPFKEFPKHLAGWGIALFIWWTGLFIMGYYNASWLTTFFSFQVYFFCWAVPCAMVLLNSPSVALVIFAHCCVLWCGRGPIALCGFLQWFYLGEAGWWIVRDQHELLLKQLKSFLWILVCVPWFGILWLLIVLL